MKEPLPQVGAPDPELKNSPIVDHSEYDDRDGLTDVELEAGVCFFNGETFAIGERLCDPDERGQHPAGRGLTGGGMGGRTIERRSAGGFRAHGHDGPVEVGHGRDDAPDG